MSVQKQARVMSGFMLSLLVIAAFNFAPVFIENYKASNAAGTYSTPDGMFITACYFGPPIEFYSRFFVVLFLLIACIGSFTKRIWSQALSFVGIAGALSSFIYWWIDSYKAFKNLSSYGTDYMSMQVAYLYHGNWWDVCLALSIFVVLILQTEEMLTKKLRLV